MTNEFALETIEKIKERFQKVQKDFTDIIKDLQYIYDTNKHKNHHAKLWLFLTWTASHLTSFIKVASNDLELIQEEFVIENQKSKKDKPK